MSIVTYNNRSIANISAIPGAAKSLTHIKTLTASSSSTLSFVDGSSDVVLDSTYPIYLFKFINIHPANNNVYFEINFSTDSGSNYNVTKTTTVFDAFHYENDGGNNLQYIGSRDLAQSTSNATIEFISNQNDQSCSGFLHLFNPSSSTFVKHFMSVGNDSWLDGSNAVSQNVYTAGYGNTTSPIDAVRFTVSSGNIDSGTIKLYGIKDS